MINIVKMLFNICLLRKGPEELPHSYILLALLIVANFIISVLVGSILRDFKVAGLSGIATLFLSFAFMKILLFNKSERFLQTFCAMLGVDTIISAASLPSFYSIEYLKLSSAAELFFNATVFALFVWVVIVYGYIFSKALSSLMSYGIAISTGYVLLSALVIDLFLASSAPT